MTLEVGSNFTDPGVQADDAVDGEVDVTVTGTVDTGTLGAYSLIYNASDASGNSATPVVRTIVIEDTTAPVIVRNGLAKAEVLQNTTYTDAGATASDNYDSSVVVSTKGPD